MKSPITGKEMVFMNIPLSIRYKDKDILYLHGCWLCVDSKEKFTTTEDDEHNLEKIQLEYKFITTPNH